MQCRPTVSKNWLHLVAGLLWTAVGLMLVNLAVGWLVPLGIRQAAPYVLAGLLLALMFYTFTFSKLVCKNVGRIEQINGEKVCIFAFQSWKSYPLILFMIALGIILRHYTPVPKPVLAVVYSGVGGGLLISSLRYYGHLWGALSIHDHSDA